MALLCGNLNHVEKQFFAIVPMKLLGFDKYVFQVLVSSSSDRALFQ